MDGMLVMMVVGKARAGLSVRMVTGAAILAAVFIIGGADASYAQTAAPIVYKSSSPSHAPTVRLENRADSTFISVTVAPAAPVPTFDSFEQRGVQVASYGPSLPIASTRLDAPKSLMSASVAEKPPSFAQPYAGPPYQVAGKWYVPAYEPNYNEVGIASWYGPTFHGKDSASGEVFDEMAMTAAHPTLPIPSLVRVTNLENGKSVVVRLNDRGPFVDDRIIDLSRAAGAALDMHAKGTAKVRVQYVGPAPAEANAAPSQPVKTQIVATQPSFTVQPLAPVAASVPAPVVRPTTQTGFFLQAGSFADLSNASALRDRLRQIGPVSISSATVNGTEFYRVMVGPWASRAEAEHAEDRLAEAGDKAIVVAKLN